MKISNSKGKIILSVLLIVILLTLSPVNGEIVTFTEHTATSDSNIDGTPNTGTSAQDYTETNTAFSGNQQIGEENIGYNTQNWVYFKDIYVNSSLVNEDLFDFPVLIDLYDSDLKTKAQTDGDDIAFFSDLGIQLNHEIQVYNPSFNSSHAYLLAWVTTDLYKNEDTRIEMRYGNSTMSSQQNVVATWTSYEHVWHLDSDPTNPVVDSTHRINGSSFGDMTPSDVVSGQIGNSINFDGNDDNIDVSGITAESWTGLTLSTWFYKTADGDARIFGFAAGTDLSDSTFSLLADNAASNARDIRARVSTDGNGGSSATNFGLTGQFSLNNWHHTAITWDSISETLTIYVDGQPITSTGKDGDTINFITGSLAAIGAAYASSSPTREFPGRIDELRISQQNKGSAWLAAEYANQLNPNNFYFVDEESNVDFADYVDQESTTDNQKDSGDISHFSDLRRTDVGSPEYYSSDLGSNTHSIGSAASGNIRIGGGTADWATPQGTISFWINFNVLTDDPKPWGQDKLFEFTIKSNNHFEIDLGEDGTIVSSQTISTGVWYFIAVVWDEYENRAELYLATESNFDLSYTSNENWQLSLMDVPFDIHDFMNSNSEPREVNGFGDDLRFYDRPLQKNELERTYNKPLRGDEPNLRSYFPFDGSTYQDFGPDGSDATVVNTINFQTTVPITEIDDTTVTFLEENPYLNQNSVRSTSTGRVQIGDGTVDWGSSEGTISMWVYIESFAASQMAWGQHGDFEIEIRTSGRVEIDIGASSIDVIVTTMSMTTFKWYFISLSWSESADLVELYIGDESTHNLEYNSVVWTDSVSSLGVSANQFMASSGVAGEELYGTADDLRYYNAQLSGSDISYYFKRTLTGTEANLQSYFPFDDNTLTDQGNAGNDASFIDTITYSTNNPLFQQGDSSFDREFKFTNIPYTQVATELAIRTGDFSAETLQLDYWSGSDWTTLIVALNPNTWNNISVFDKISSSEFVIRFVDTNRTFDTNVESWNFHSILLRYENNQLDWEHGISGVDPNREYYDLNIRGQSSSSSENFDVSLWDQVSDWSPTLTTIGSTLTWYNTSITNPGYIANTMYVRYTDTNRTVDYDLDTLSLDYVSISSYDIDPVLTTTPSTENIDEGPSSYVITWVATDDNPNVYNIYVDGALEVSNGVWSSGANIDFDFGALDLDYGTYNLTIEILDDYSGRTVYQSDVNVNDVTNPVINSPSDFTINETRTSVGWKLNWTISDRHDSTYDLLQNGSSVATGSWVSGVELGIDQSVLSKGVYNYTIIAVDESGNDVVDTIIVTVVDEKAPEISTPSDDINYVEDSTGNEVSWTFADNYPDYYVIYQNGSQVNNGTWASLTPITWGIDGLTVGDYNFTIVVFDESGLVTKDTVIVFSRDMTDPSLNSPIDFSYEYGTTGHSITWQFNDTNLMTVTYYIDNNEIFSFQTSSGDFTANVDGASLGNHFYKIVVTDQYGNTVEDEVQVIVEDTIAPILSSNSGNKTASEVSTNNRLSWTATDLLPNNYEIYVNSSSQTTGAFVSGGTVYYNFDALTKGTYNVTIVFTDQGGNQLVSELWVTVIDTTNPSIDTPSDITYEYGVTSNSITWTPSDAYPFNYTIYRDGTFLTANTWDGITPITINIDGLNLGNYNYTIIVADESLNAVVDTVIVTVTDSVNPSVSDLTTKVYYEDEATKTVEWTATDDFASTYTIYQDGVVVDSGSWTSGIEVSYSISSLTLGEYNLSIIFYDQSGNYITDQSTVQILDRIDPAINSPSDVTYQQGSTGNQLSWTASDNHPSQLTLYRNGTIIQSRSWSSGTIVFDIDGLAVGIYNYTIVITDSTGNSNSDTLIVTVEDNVLPVISNPPSNTTISEFSTGNSISWKLTDLNADYYVVYNNNSAGSQLTWNSGNTISYNLDGLAFGLTNITIQVFDTSGNFAIHTVWITVVDTTDPVVSSPSDFTYEFGTTENSINWLPTDAHPVNYTIYRNDIVNTTGQWTSSNAIILGVDGLSLGIHNFTILLEDIAGNIVVDTVLVNVVDTTIPAISNATSDFQFNEESGSYQLSWTATDTFATTYRIYRNGALHVSSTSWTTGIAINLDISDLLKGTYNFTIVFRDSSGNINSSEVIVTVVDENAPVITPQPNDSYSEGTQSFYINWPVSDNHPDQLTLYRNGTVVLSNNWETSTLNIQIGGLSLGVYNFTLVLTDESGNTAIDTIFVTVFDDTLPILTSPEDQTFSQFSDGNEIIWVATDIHAANYSIYSNNTLVKQGNWISGTNISRLVNTNVAGRLNLTIFVQDTSGNIVRDEVTVIITAEPVFTSRPADIDYNPGDSGNILSWTLDDIDPDNYTIYQDGVVVDSGLWNNETAITWNVDGLSLGSYNFTIIVQDDLGNIVSDEVNVVVSDVPVWDEPRPSDATYSEGDPASIVWNATDQFPDSWVVYRNGSFYASGTGWTNASAITVDISGLTIGNYEFTIHVNDTSNNVIIDTVIITIIDTTNPSATDLQSDYTTSEVSTGNTISWTFTDLHAANYTILISTGGPNSTYAFGDWTSGVPITYNIDDLTKGVYTFYILVQDTSGNTVQFSAVITIQDQTSPVISNSNINNNSTIITEISTNNWLNVTAVDTYADTVTIYHNISGSIEIYVLDAIWNSGIATNHSLEIYSFGVYIIIFEFTDVSGNAINQSYIITVIDATNPVIEDEPDIPDYIEGSGGNSITWTTTETNRDYYVIYLDDVVAVNTTWTGDITYNIDGLAYGTHNVTVVVYDQSDNFSADQVEITVLDTTNPIIEDEPDIPDYIEGSNGNSITWTTTELNPDYYVIYLDDVVAVNTTWTGDITYSIDGLAYGTHNVTVVVYDQSGLTAQDEVIITVLDTTNPDIEDEADISDYIEGSGGNSITWNSTEINRDYYVIYLDDVVAVNTTWTGDITYNIDGLAYGTHNVTVVVYDQSGNFAIDQVQITVLDTTNPIIEDEPDISDYIEGSTGNSITWTTTELNRDYYVIYLDDVVAVNTTWTGDITYNIDGLAYGTHNVTVVVYDLSDNFAVDQVQITVLDTTNPIIEDEPDIPDYIEGSGGNSITWTTTELNPDYYVIYLDDVVTVNTTWTGDITYNIDGLSYGTHNVTVVVYDLSGLTAQDEVIITVLDTTNPIIEDEPDIPDYIEGSTGNSITWTTTELNPDYYVIYLDDVVAVNTTWTGDITYNIDGLAYGTHNVTVVVYDLSGLTAQDEVIITVLDTTNPIIEDEPDISDYIEGSNGNSIIWTTTELNPDYYVVYLDDVVDVNATWTGDITYNIDGLAYGTHNVTVVVYDLSGLTTRDEVLITVLDTTDPVINSPSDVTYEFGSFGNTITWITTETNPDYYQIYINGTPGSQIPWSGNIIYDIDGFDLGVYNITIVVVDLESQTAIDEVILTVSDTTNPVIEDEPDIPDYIEGSGGNSITWTTAELKRDYYVIYLDDAVVFNLTWTGDITYLIDGLTYGIHNITVVVYDTSGNFATDQVEVTVLDNTDPVIEDEPDISDYIEDTTGNSITWSTTEANPSYYVIYLDDVVDLNATWTGDVTYDIDGLTLGNHNVTIVVVDQSGRSAQDQVLITVLDTTDPIFISQPPSQVNMSEGDIGVELVWIVSDTNPNEYVIYINGSIDVSATSWTSGIPPYSLDGFLKGVYIFNITINDTSGNVLSQIVRVNVFDTTSPVITSPSSISYSEGGSIDLVWSASDNYAQNYTVELNSGEDVTVLDEGIWVSGENITIPLSGEGFGTYTIIIKVQDQSGNLRIKSISLSVTDDTNPEITVDQPDVSFTEQQDVILSWTATDLHAGTYIITRNGVQIGSGGWTSGVEIQLNFGQLTKGSYTFQIIFRDNSLNQITSSVNVVIEDVTPPVVPADSTFIARRGNSGNIISWTVTDPYPGYYVIYSNGSDITGNSLWFSGTPITFDVFTPTELDLGYYNFTIHVFDQSGNNATSTIIVQVVDGTAPVIIGEGPADLVFSEGNNTNELVWEFYDATPFLYFIYQDGSQVDSNVWVSNSSISYLLEDLEKGVYNFTIIASDAVFNNATDWVIVTVLDTQNPLFVNVPDDTLQYIEQTTGNTLSWTMTDNHASMYYLYINGSFETSGIWMNDIPFVYNMDGLSYGTYNFTIVVEDESGNFIRDTTFVSVFDETVPVFNSEPTSFEYIEGQSGYSLTWVGSDLHPATYELAYNGETNRTGVWISNTNIVLDIDGLSYGTYNITLTLIDESGNFVISYVIIDVEDHTLPVITSVPENLVININDTTGSISWVATDLNPGTYVVFLNGIQYQSRTWVSGNQITVSVYGLEVGFYNFTIYINDVDLNQVSSSVEIRMKDPTLIDSQKPEFELTTMVYEGDVEVIQGVWLDVNNNPISGGTITVSFILQDELFSYQTTTLSDGSYELIFNYTDYDPDSYRWTIDFESETHQAWLDLEYEIEILPHNYAISLDLQAELVRGQEYFILALVSYANPSANGTLSGLSLNQLTGRSGPAEGVTVSFLIQYVTLEGTNGSLSPEGISQANGIVQVVIPAGITESIARLTGIQATISSTSNNSGANATLDPSNFPIAIDGDPGLVARIYQAITDNVFSIALAIAMLFGLFAIVIYFQNRKRRRIEELNQSIKQALEEVEALESMKAIIIQTKSKLTLYEELVNSDDSMNTNLVGGMVSAFSSFLNEIGRGEALGFETMERGDVSLTVHRGKESNMIFITESKLPFILLRQIKTAQEKIEYEFQSFLQNTTRGVKKLKRDQIHPQLTAGGFKIDLLGRLKLNSSNIRPVLRERSVSRAIKTNIEMIVDLPSSRYAENGTFRLTDIIDFFSSRSINRQMSARIIMAAYQFGVIQKDD